jgi:hypothetical protein
MEVIPHPPAERLPQRFSREQTTQVTKHQEDKRIKDFIQRTEKEEEKRKKKRKKEEEKEEGEEEQEEGEEEIGSQGRWLKDPGASMLTAR